MNTMKTLYSFHNHAATCKEVSEQIGKTPSYYVNLATKLAIRVAGEMNIHRLPARDDSNKEVYWYILFYGQDVKNQKRGSFEWKLRPELAEALEELYPNLDYPEPAIFNRLAMWNLPFGWQLPYLPMKPSASLINHDQK